MAYREYKPLNQIPVPGMANQLLQPINYGELYDVIDQIDRQKQADQAEEINKYTIDTKKEDREIQDRIKSGYADDRQMTDDEMEKLFKEYGRTDKLSELTKSRQAKVDEQRELKKSMLDTYKVLNDLPPEIANQIAPRYLEGEIPRFQKKADKDKPIKMETWSNGDREITIDMNNQTEVDSARNSGFIRGRLRSSGGGMKEIEDLLKETSTPAPGPGLFDRTFGGSKAPPMATPTPGPAPSGKLKASDLIAQGYVKGPNGWVPPPGRR